MCADPVTGSSSIPDCGAKKRETKSTCVPGAVTIRPLALSFEMILKSGCMSFISSSVFIRSNNLFCLNRALLG